VILRSVGPVISTRRSFSAAGAVGDQGARAYLREHRDAIRLVECSDVAQAYDIDTAQDLSHLE
ncbi:hypothetical protein JHN53_18780, partial [Streptomyces sp. MBT58]|nr:hypothetical protein [Streptomyces sp. MBT58]